MIKSHYTLFHNTNTIDPIDPGFLQVWIVDHMGVGCIRTLAIVFCDWKCCVESVMSCVVSSLL